MNIKHTRHAPFRHAVADASESLRAANKRNIIGSANPHCIADKAIAVDELTHRESRHIEIVDRLTRRRALRQTVGIDKEQKVIAVATDVGAIGLPIGVGQWLHEPCLQIEPRQRVARAPIRHTVVGMNDFVDAFLFLRTFLLVEQHQAIFGRRHVENLRRHITEKCFHTPRRRVDNHQPTMTALHIYIVIAVGRRHPRRRLKHRTRRPGLGIDEQRLALKHLRGVVPRIHH